MMIEYNVKGSFSILVSLNALSAAVSSSTRSDVSNDGMQLRRPRVPRQHSASSSSSVSSQGRDLFNIDMWNNPPFWKPALDTTLDPTYNQDSHPVFPHHCPCHSCTDEVWNRNVMGLTCGERIHSLYAAYNDVFPTYDDACRYVGNMEFPMECGDCDPSTCDDAVVDDTNTPAIVQDEPIHYCGCPDTCYDGSDSVWRNGNADGVSCGARISWLTLVRKVPEYDACVIVGDEFPTVCSPGCDPRRCVIDEEENSDNTSTDKTISEEADTNTAESGDDHHCTCQSCTDEVWNTMVHGASCGARIGWLRDVYPNVFGSETDACHRIAEIEFPDSCGACNPNTCDGSEGDDNNNETPPSTDTETTYYCGCPDTCTSAVWSGTSTGGIENYSCGARITWLKLTQPDTYPSEQDACRKISIEYPTICGPACDPDQCTPNDTANDETYNTMAPTMSPTLTPTTPTMAPSTTPTGPTMVPTAPTTTTFTPTVNLTTISQGENDLQPDLPPPPGEEIEDNYNEDSDGAASSKKDYSDISNITCGCPMTCTQDVLERVAIGPNGIENPDEPIPTCGSRIQWVLDEFHSFTEVDACIRVGDKEFSDLCGECNPYTCGTTLALPPPTEIQDSYCGCDSCTHEIWERDAGGYPCGERVLYIQQTNEYARDRQDVACSIVANDFPTICGPACDPYRCDGKTKNDDGTSRGDFSSPGAVYNPIPMTSETELYCYPSYADRTRYLDMWDGDYIMEVKELSSVCGPGDNLFSTDTISVNRDGPKDELVLEYKKVNGVWTASEVRIVMDDDTMPFQYGTYRFSVKSIEIIDEMTQTATSSGALPADLTLGLFTWDDTERYDIHENYNHEVDIELAKWGDADEPHDAQFLVQPPEDPQYFRFSTSQDGDGGPPSQDGHIYEFTWYPGEIHWYTDAGGGVNFTYSTQQAVDGGYIDYNQCMPADVEVRINLWNMYGTVQPMDVSNTEFVRVIIDDFVYIPTDQRYLNENDTCTKNCQCNTKSLCIHNQCKEMVDE